MFSLIKQVFIVLLSFSKSLAIKCVSLNNEPCTIRPFLIDLNPVEFKYYPFMISLHKCSGSCNSTNDLPTKIFILNRAKGINIKEFNIITNKNEAKALVKHISYDCECELNSTTCNSNKKWNNETCQ